MFYGKKSYSLTKLNLSTDSLGKSQNSINAKFSNSPGENKLPTKHNPFLGFFYTFITSIFITLSSVFVKKLKYINPGYLSLVRNAGVFAGCLPLAIYNTTEVIGEKKDRLMLFIRAFFGATALYLNLTAFRYLPLAEAAIVMSTTPALTSILAFFYLKEPCGVIQIFGLVLTVAGVLLSVRLPELISNRNSARFDYYYVAGLASAVGCVLFLSIAFVTLRKMRKIHFSVTLLYFGFVGMIENASISSITSTFEYPRCGWDQIFVMLIGIFGFIGHCTLTLAIQKEAVGIISILKASLDIIVAFVFQIIFFDDHPDVYNIGGACLVIVSVSIMGIRNWLKILPEDSKTRERLKCFLL